jgi:hypothetical protein
MQLEWDSAYLAIVSFFLQIEMLQIMNETMIVTGYWLDE